MNNSAQIANRINELNRQRAETLAAEQERIAAEQANQRQAQALEADVYDLTKQKLKAEFYEMLADAPTLAEETRQLTKSLIAAFARHDMIDAKRVYADLSATFQRLFETNRAASQKLDTLERAIWQKLMQNPASLPTDPHGVTDAGSMASSLAAGETHLMRQTLKWGISQGAAVTAAIAQSAPNTEDRQIRQGIGYALLREILDPVPGYEPERATHHAITNDPRRVTG